MAVLPRELFSSVTPATPLRVTPEVTKSELFASGSVTIAHLQPVAFNTSSGFYVPWDNAGINGANLLKGFMLEKDGLVLQAANEVRGVIMFTGTIHRDDIPAASSFYNDAELVAELQAEARILGLIVQGLDSIR